MIFSRAIPFTAVVFAALPGLTSAASAASEVYIEQAHGRAQPSSSVMTKPPPESTAQASQPAAAPTAPDTCNAQNAASSQACYTATQQARPASR